MNWLGRRAAIGGLLSAAPTAFFGAAWAQQPSIGSSRLAPVEGDEIVMSLDTWTDTYGRPTASVTINGRGPFAFLVDTGSTVTVISERLALNLGAASAGAFTVTGATGTAVRPFTFVEALQAGDVKLNKLRVAIMSDARLARCDGILGADVFAGKRLVFSIRDKIVRVEPSLRLASATPRNLRLRHGLLAEVDGRVGKIPAKLMLDTGADYCVANPALGEALRKAHPWQGRIPHVRIVGVDLLSRLASFTIDYGARTFDAQLAMGLDLIARNEGALS